MRNIELYQPNLYHKPIEEYSVYSKSAPFRINPSPYSDPSANYSISPGKYVSMAGAGQGYQSR